MVEHQDHLLYPAGVIEFLEDRVEVPDSELTSEAQQAYAEIVRRATDREPSDPDLRRWMPTKIQLRFR